MVVQRYFSTSNLKSARRSFATAVGFGLLINSLLVFVGLAMLYFYRTGLGELPLDPKVKRDADLIFPLFMVRELPAGLAGAVLTAVLSAAMSTIDAGINAIATVISAERDRPHGRDLDAEARPGAAQVRYAQLVTLIAGACITLSAYGLDTLVRDRNILEMMPRSFNCFLMPIGVLFLLGMFTSFVGTRSAVAAAIAAFATAISIAYAKELYGTRAELSFTWIMPGSLAVGFAVGLLGSLFERPRSEQTAGLTWFTRHRVPLIDHRLFAPWVIEESRRDQLAGENA